MEFPQIDAASCAILVTLFLWVWSRLKLPLACNFQEACLRQQNHNTYWAFGTLVLLEILASRIQHQWMAWAVGPASGMVFYLFAIGSFQTGAGFWSKRRNQVLSLPTILFGSFTVALIVKEAYFIPMFGAFALSHICHKKYIQMVCSSIQDLETLQAKVLKQEAMHANSRNFDSSSGLPASQQA